MTTQRTFAQRVGLHWLCVAPATILTDTCDPEEDGSMPLSLREEASSDGLCFLRVLRPLSCGDLYQGQVAATPDLLCSQPISIFLTEAQLRFALPWDVRLQGKQKDSTPDGGKILTLLHAHAAAVQPAIQKIPHPLNSENIISVEVPQKAVQDYSALEISQQMQDAPTRIQEDGFRLQHAFLFAVLDALMERLYQGIEHVKALALKAQCALVVQVLRRHRETRQCLVNAVPYFSQEKQRTLWHLSMHIPEGFSLVV